MSKLLLIIGILIGVIIALIVALINYAYDLNQREQELDLIKFKLRHKSIMLEQVENKYINLKRSTNIIYGKFKQHQNTEV